MTLGRMESVDLRSVWPHEALDFSAWLSKSENLALLSDALGIDIEAIQTEAVVGRFRIDLLAQDSNTEDKIIIENQLESTDHDHLGKVITYAAGLDAKYVVWIVRDFLPEHQQAVDWLNENVSDDLFFFLIKLELWRIGDSVPAPKFSVISQKNNWVSTMKHSLSSGELSDTRIKQLEFWQDFCEFIREKDPKYKLRNPRASYAFDFPMGSSIAHPYAAIHGQRNEIECVLYINHNKDFLAFLKEREEQIKTDLGQNFEWWEANQSSGISVSKRVEQIFGNGAKEDNFEWLLKNVNLFKKVFMNYIAIFKGGNL